MRLFNQKSLPLSWDIDGDKFTCEGYGAVDVPDKLAWVCKVFELPLGPAPVSEEVRGARKAERERAKAEQRGDGQLRKEAALAHADLKAAREETERVANELAEANEAKGNLEALLESANAEIERLNGVKLTLEGRLSEMANDRGGKRGRR